MINATRRLSEFEARYGRDAFRELSYGAALALFAALWAEARALDPRLGTDWEAVNGLPPTA
jgi:hypothetical protein